jgi:D-alanyl-D-alanine carboxypeptidase/D-alanyl-D-alanine-endopeptidase (penicillin-binding protein 4)
MFVAGCAARHAPEPLSPSVYRLAVELDSAFTGPEFARAEWGVVVQSLDNGQVLYRRNAEHLFMPASNQKILTGAVALARLGAGFRWVTPVLAAGSRHGDTLSGDLVVVGRGDPTLSQHASGGEDVLAALRPWADSVRAKGIRVIDGAVAGDATFFPDPPLGEGWMWDDLADSYSAPVGALQFNEGFALLEVTPGAGAGDTLLVRLLPPGAPLRVVSIGITAPADSNVNTLRFTRALASDSVSLWGRLSARHAPVRFEVSVGDPTRYFAAALAQVLREAGITVTGRRAERPPTSDTLFTWSSPRLDSTLRLLEKPSQNQIAEALLRTLGGAAKGTASVDSGRAALQETLRGWGVPDDAYVYADGSGLSRYNYVAPEAIARVLAGIARDSAFPAFYDALPVAGVDGTLEQRLRGTAAQNNARAKTGSIANVRTMSGYVTTRDGERLLFVLMANHFTAPARAATLVQDHVVERLANFTRAAQR